MPVEGVLRLDDDAFVAEVRYDEIVVRHYAFADRWFKINCTTDLERRLVETKAPEDVPPFAFNCDIATPMLRRGRSVFAVDLWLDVLVRLDGVTFGVYDWDEFAAALQHGWLSEREATAARAGLRDLVELIERVISSRCSLTCSRSRSVPRLRRFPRGASRSRRSSLCIRAPARRGDPPTRRRGRPGHAAQAPPSRTS
jgi:hypothetical protein